MTEQQQSFLYDKPPAFALGQTVWALNTFNDGRAAIDKTEICSVRVALSSKKGKLRAYVQDYFCLLIVFTDGGGGPWWPENYLFATEKEAEEATRFLPVTLSKSAWKQAFAELRGSRNDAIRNWLRQCKRNGGMIVFHRNQLQQLLHDYLDQSNPPAKQKHHLVIFEQLGVTWAKPGR